jgi:hypothetical protein
MRRNDEKTRTVAMDAVLELSRMAKHIALEEMQTLLYDLEHTAPMSVECALARAFLDWRKQLERIRKE